MMSPEIISLPLHEGKYLIILDGLSACNKAEDLALSLTQFVRATNHQFPLLFIVRWKLALWQWFWLAIMLLSKGKYVCILHQSALYNTWGSRILLLEWVNGICN